MFRNPPLRNEKGPEPIAILVAPLFEFKIVTFDAFEVGGDSSPFSEASENTAGQFMGRIEGVPVFRFMNAPHDRETWCIISVAGVRPRRYRSVKGECGPV